jgi:hypothetical protein
MKCNVCNGQGVLRPIDFWSLHGFSREGLEKICSRCAGTGKIKDCKEVKEETPLFYKLVLGDVFDDDFDSAIVLMSKELLCKLQKVRNIDKS